MIELGFNKNSWHFGLATFYRDSWDARHFNETDICSYIRKIILGSVIFTAMSLVIFLCLYSVYASLVYLAIGIYFGAGSLYYNSLPMPVEAGFLILVIVAVLGTIMGLGYWYSDGNLRQIFRINIISLPQPPSFISEAYRSIKDKTCFKIRFK